MRILQELWSAWRKPDRPGRTDQTRDEAPYVPACKFGPGGDYVTEWPARKPAEDEAKKERGAR